MWIDQLDDLPPLDPAATAAEGIAIVQPARARQILSGWLFEDRGLDLFFTRLPTPAREADKQRSSQADAMRRWQDLAS